MARFELKLPKMGESVAEATITNWLKAVGDTIEADEAVLEIATDKVDSEVPSEVQGILVEKLFDNDDLVQVGQTIAIIETAAVEIVPKEEVEQFVAVEVPPHEQVAATVEATVPKEEIVQEVEKEVVPAETVSKVDVVQEVENTIEPLKSAEDISESGRFYSPLVKNIALEEGITVEELEAMNGSGKEGRITKNDILEYVAGRSGASVPEIEKEVSSSVPSAPIVEESEVEKVIRPVEAPAPIVEELKVEKEINQTTASVPEIKKEVSSSITSLPVVEESKAEKVINQTTASVPEIKKEVSSSITSLPVVEESNAEKVVNQIIASVPEVEKTPVPKERTVSAQEIPKIQKPMSTGKAAPVSVNGADEIIEMDRMGKMIAHHMIKSVQTSAHVQSFIEVDVTNICKWREKNKNAFERREGEKLTYTPIFMEAVAKAIKDFPLINVSVDGDFIIKKKNINLGMAAALPSGNLIVPVIKNADQLNLVGMAKAVNDLASRARNNRLKPDDIQGGTYTVTNIGTFGSIFGTPIINQPQVAILALGAIRKVPAVIETPGGDFIGIRHKMFLSHSYDHRVVNGALGGEFLKRVAEYLEEFDINRDF